MLSVSSLSWINDFHGRLECTANVRFTAVMSLLSHGVSSTVAFAVVQVVITK